MGRIPLPSLDEMRKETLRWRAREETLENPKQEILFQGDYVKDLLSKTDYPFLDVDGINQALFEWKEHKKDDIMGFRNCSFRSLITGTQSPPHHTPWLDALDDSLEDYLQDHFGARSLTVRTTGAGAECERSALVGV